MIRAIATAAIATAAAACMVGAATPAFANDAAPRMSYQARTGMFCTPKEPITGSLVPVAECHTAAGWAQAGLVVRVAPRIARR